MTLFKYVESSVVGYFMSLALYHVLIFRNAGYFSSFESRIIFYIMLLMITFLNYTWVWLFGRERFSVVKNIILGYGVYTLFTYYYIMGRLFLYVLSGCALLEFIYTAAVLMLSIYRKKSRVISKRNIKKILIASRNILCCGMLVILVTIIINRVFGLHIMMPVTEAVSTMEGNSLTIADNIDELMQLEESVWSIASEEKKINILQLIADMEQSRLGLSYGLKVCAEYGKQNELAFYDDSNRRIVINKDALSDHPAYDMVNSICHEAYHSYQHRTIDLYNSVKDVDKSLMLFNDAKAYLKEFNDYSYYSGASDNFYDYYSQNCESDAREYAETATKRYYDKIDEYRINRNMCVDDIKWHVYYIDADKKRFTDYYLNGYPYEYQGTYARVQFSDGKWGIIDRKGETVFSGADSINELPMCTTYGSAVADGQAVLFEFDDAYGRPFRIIKKFEEFNDISEVYMSSFAIVKNAEGMSGVVDYKGNVIIPAEYLSVEFENINNEVIFSLDKPEGGKEEKRVGLNF